jgi:hypothetical protein
MYSRLMLSECFRYRFFSKLLEKKKALGQSMVISKDGEIQVIQPE